MKISVITATYNAEKTIEETLLSVRTQSHSEREHIVIDGASKDGSMDIVKRYAPHLAYVVSEPDRGVYDAMNKGIALASGEVIGLLNADDIYAHDGVLTRIAEAFKTETLDAVFADAVFVSPEDPLQVVRRYSSARFRPDRISWGWMPAHPTLFVRRSLFERFGPFNPEYRIAGDFEWVARVFSSPGIHYRYLPEEFVRMRTGGISTGGWRNTLLLNREVLRACRENGIPTNWLKILSKYPAKLLEFLNK
ncbi:MAG: glycosyltransferase family 2 protein [Pseudomonadota bacterium]|nr:glycosyltransferase family 2 protein [Pseudomonadota bacterium]